MRHVQCVSGVSARCGCARCERLRIAESHELAARRLRAAGEHERALGGSPRGCGPCRRWLGGRARAGRGWCATSCLPTLGTVTTACPEAPDVLIGRPATGFGFAGACGGRAGWIAGTAVAGFADSQSAALSAAMLVPAGHASTTAAALAILAALTTNTASRAGLAAAAGRPSGEAMRFAIWPGLAVILCAASGGLAIAQAG
jgi:hypothetical protein